MDEKNILIKICELITENDPDVLAEVEECVNNIGAYVETHLDEYEHQSMSLEDSSAEDLMWLGVVNCLIRNGYVGKFDSDITKVDFGWELKSLRGYKLFDLRLDEKFTNEDYAIDSYDVNEDDDIYDYEDEERFVEDESVESWCKYLNNSWADEDICLGMIDTDMEEYTIFLAETEVLEQLEELADSIDRHISTVY